MSARCTCCALSTRRTCPRRAAITPRRRRCPKRLPIKRPKTRRSRRRPLRPVARLHRRASLRRSGGPGMPPPAKAPARHAPSCRRRQARGRSGGPRHAARAAKAGAVVHGTRHVQGIGRHRPGRVRHVGLRHRHAEKTRRSKSSTCATGLTACPRATRCLCAAPRARTRTAS